MRGKTERKEKRNDKKMKKGDKSIKCRNCGIEYLESEVLCPACGLK